jgi:hypothetical protein
MSRKLAHRLEEVFVVQRVGKFGAQSMVMVSESRGMQAMPRMIVGIAKMILYPFVYLSK